MLDLGDHPSRSVPGCGLVVEAPIADQRRVAVPAARPSEQILDLALDSGPGLDVEGLDRLFDAFHQAGRHGHGAFDLPFDHRSSRGRIWRSRNVGAGATFQFTMPVASAPNA